MPERRVRPPGKALTLGPSLDGADAFNTFDDDGSLQCAPVKKCISEYVHLVYQYRSVASRLLRSIRLGAAVAPF